MAVSLAPQDWHFPPTSSPAASMDRSPTPPKQIAFSSSTTNTTTASSQPPPRRDSSSAGTPSPTTSASEKGPSLTSMPATTPSPPINGLFVPSPIQQSAWSPQPQVAFPYPLQFGYFSSGQSQGSISPFGGFDASQLAQQPNPQQMAQWAAYQQAMFTAQQQQQQQFVAAVAAGMMSPPGPGAVGGGHQRQRTGSAPGSSDLPRPHLAAASQQFGAGQMVPGMFGLNAGAGAFQPAMMAFPNGSGGSVNSNTPNGLSSGRGASVVGASASEANSGIQTQAFHPYKRTRGSHSTSSAPTSAPTAPSHTVSASLSSSASAPAKTIAGLPPSAFPPLQAVQPPYARRERTNSGSSANSSRSSKSTASRPGQGSSVRRGVNETASPIQKPSLNHQPRSASTSSSNNGRTTPSIAPRQADNARSASPVSISSGRVSPSPGPGARTSPTSPSTSSPATTPTSPSSPTTSPAASSTQNPTGSVRARAPPKPSPLSQQTSMTNEFTAPTITSASAVAPAVSTPALSPSQNALKRVSRDDSDLKAFAAEQNAKEHASRTGGLKDRIRRALSLAPADSLEEKAPPLITVATRKQPPTTLKSEGKKPAAIVAMPPMPLSPNTPTSTPSGSTIGASGNGPPTPVAVTEYDAAEYPGADGSIRSAASNIKSNKKRTLFNRKWNASTDNISLSSTMSSASLIIRKIGSVGALARRKSLTGITSLFKDKDKKRDGTDDKEDKKKGKKGLKAAIGVSHVTAEVERMPASTSTASDEMVGLSPAAKLARQHTLRSNAEAAARAEADRKAREEASASAAAAAEAEAAVRTIGSDGPPVWENDTTNRRGGRGHARGYSEDGSEEGFTYVSYSGPNGAPEGYFEDDFDAEDGELEDDEDVTIRRESLEVEPWAIGVRRSIERVRVPERGILKYAATYSQERDLHLGRAHSLTRSRANSYDTVSQNHYRSEPGPLARIPSADPDHIDGLQSQMNDTVSDLLPPLNLHDISNFSDSSTSSIISVHPEKASNSPYAHPNMNSSMPTLSLRRENFPGAGARSQTTPNPHKKISFAANLSVYDTFSANAYDRRSEPATCNHLTPALAQRIKEELNSYKMEEMEVHFASRAHTQFFV